MKSNTVQSGDFAYFIDPRGKKHLRKLTPNGTFQTNHGILEMSDLIGQPWGSRVKTHLGKVFLMVQPSLNDIILSTKRATTIMYPKDIGFILLNMNIGENCRVIEAGTGSGALTTAFSWAVGSTGRVYSYETRKETQDLARKNLSQFGLEDRVEFKNKDIGLGFDENNMDSIFLDVPNPEDYLQQVQVALKTGGFFGSLVPTTNQVSRLLESLNAHSFGFIEVCEIMLRYYKPISARLRPDDRMTAHTGFLIFSRSIFRN